MTLIAVDSRNRVSLTKVLGKNRTEFFEATVNPEGDIILRPMTAIPEREKWALEKPGLKEQIIEGIAQSKTGRIKPFSEIR